MTAGAIPFNSYELCLADPPWKYETYSNEGNKKSASAKYPTMPTAEIIALRQSLNLDWVFAPDAVLGLWGTWPMMARGDVHAVMRGWGFTPVSGGSWHKITARGKDTFGGGYMFRDSCEPYLIGVRGEPGRPPKGQRNWRNGFRAKRGEHSEKPIYLHRALEAMYPRCTSRLEMFARARRARWDAWGLEVDGRLQDFQRPQAQAADFPLLSFMGAS